MKKNNFTEFEKELEHLINRHSMEKYIGMPDYAIAEYLMNCFTALQDAVYMRDTKGIIPDIDLKETV